MGLHSNDEFKKRKFERLNNSIVVWMKTNNISEKQLVFGYYYEKTTSYI